MTNTELPALLPCPFCGQSGTAKVQAASDDWDVDNEGPYPHSESWYVVCDASSPGGPGGCGAASGYNGIGPERAAEAWNKRAALAAQSAPAAEPTTAESYEVRCSDCGGNGLDWEDNQYRCQRCNGTGFVEMLLRPAVPAAEAVQPVAPELCFTLREATELLQLFGGSQSLVTVRPLPKGDVKDEEDPDYISLAGLYAHFTEYPEDGCWYLGPVDQHADDWTPPAATPPAAVPVAPAADLTSRLERFEWVLSEYMQGNADRDAVDAARHAVYAAAQNQEGGA